ncbi:MAG: hypothetical protein J1E85_09600 [Ruminococcus sp.]|nr:hypothetical protein [Ruminococcus sp.]
MKINRFMYIIVLAVCLITALSGCFPSADDNNKIDVGTLDTANIYTQSHITKNLDYISVDADIAYPQSSSFDVYNVKMAVFDFDRLKSIFIKNTQNITITEENDTDYAGYTAHIAHSDDENLGVYRDFFEYTTAEYDKLSFFLSSQDYPVGFDGMSDCFQKEKLNSLDKDNSLEIVIDTINELNLPVDKTPEIYSLDYKSLNNRSKSLYTDEEYEQMNIKYNFTEKDEAYLFVFHSKTNTLNHYDRYVSIFQDGIPTYGGEVYAVVNSNGLIMFGAYGMYDIQETVSENQNMIGIDTVLDIINNRYKNIMADVIVESLSPYYFPIKESSTAEIAKLTPVWVVKTSERIEEQGEKGNMVINDEEYYIIDAITGKVIL